MGELELRNVGDARDVTSLCACCNVRRGTKRNLDVGHENTLASLFLSDGVNPSAE